MTWTPSGVLYSVLGSVCFIILQSIIKSYKEIDVLEFIFFRGLFGWIFCLTYLSRYKVSLLGNCRGLLILRSVLGLSSMILFMISLRHLPLGVAVTLSQTYPILTAILAMFFLGERIRIWHWFFLLLSFSGVLLIKNFDTRVDSLYLTLSLLGSFLVAGVYIVIRKIGNRDHPLVIVHYFMLLTTLISGVLMLPFWLTPNIEQWGAILTVGILGCLGQFCMTKSLQLEQAHKIAKLGYLKNVFAFLIGYLFFTESYGLTTLLGVFLIIISAFSDLSFRKVKKIPRIHF